MEPSAFLTTTMGATYCEYITCVTTFISSRRFSSLFTSGSAAYATRRLGRKTGFVEVPVWLRLECSIPGYL